MTNKKYIVVENSGMVGEQDIRSFDRWMDAIAHMKKSYDADELDQFSPNCLHVAIAMEVDGERTYDF